VQSPEQIREHYAIERELADRLRSAPSKEARRQLYAVVYEERSRRIAHHPLVERAADPAARAVAAAPQVRLILPFVCADSTFAEVGAGDGAVARGVAPHVRSATAIDVTDALALPDDEAVGFVFRVFDGFDLGLTDLDVVYSNDVAEHLHPDDFLDHARAILCALKPGGRYLCVTPNRLSGPHDISKHFSDVPRGFHLREYTALELGAALRAAGFADVKVIAAVGGRRFSPPLPLATIAPFERVIRLLPARLRRRAALGLAVMKVIGVKAA
jgi:SAM-dependent methyltransferase